MGIVPSFDDAHLEAICEVLGETNEGLTGSEIAKLLAICGITDPLPGHTKRVRLFEALRARQALDGAGNKVAEFIQTALNPVRHTANSANFEIQRAKLNTVLAFSGIELRADGKLRRVERAETLSEAERRSGHLRSELMRRKVHHEVLRFCRPELLQKDYFHAVLEAAKSLAEKLRHETGLTSDGAELVDQSLGLGKAGVPLLAVNALATDTERSVHSGLMGLLKGVFGVFRNPPAHVPRIIADMNEDDALEALTIMSYLHRWLERAVPTPALIARRSGVQATP